MLVWKDMNECLKIDEKFRRVILKTEFTKWNGPNDTHFFKIVTELPLFAEIPMEHIVYFLNPISQGKRQWSSLLDPSQRGLNFSQGSPGHCCEQVPHYQVIWGTRWLMHWLSNFLCTMLQAQNFAMTQTLTLWSRLWPMSEALCRPARSHRTVKHHPPSSLSDSSKSLKVSKIPRHVSAGKTESQQQFLF